MASARIHADGDIGDQSDTHALLACILLNRREAACGEPLQEHVELDFARLGGGEVRCGGCAWCAPSGGPIAPTPYRLRLCSPVPLQRLEPCVLAQAVPA